MLFNHQYKQTLEINETKLFEMKTYTNEGVIQTNDTIVNSRRCKYTCEADMKTK